MDHHTTVAYRDHVIEVYHKDNGWRYRVREANAKRTQVASKGGISSQTSALSQGMREVNKRMDHPRRVAVRRPPRSVREKLKQITSLIIEVMKELD